MINIAKNPFHHDRTKHVEIDCHFIKEKIKAGVIKMIYTPTCLQITDTLTKALPRVSFEALINKMRMIDTHAPTWGEVWESR